MSGLAIDCYLDLISSNDSINVRGDAVAAGVIERDEEKKRPPMSRGQIDVPSEAVEPVLKGENQRRKQRDPKNFLSGQVKNTKYRVQCSFPKIDLARALAFCRLRGGFSPIISM